MLSEKYHSEINAILTKYPPDQKRSAVMPMLYLAQSEYGYISQAVMAEVAGILGLEPTQVASIVGFYSLYYDHKGGVRRVQICADLPCALHGADKFAEDLCARFGVKLGGTTKGGEFTIEAVMCLAACDKAPMFQIQDATGIHYHENMTVDRAERLLNDLKDGMR
ncbi:MAG: NADH-quinone oxidoreductase subunit NuoE [Chloroflexi bacterium]|nr:NADH-quinone oxidoreductase subunit NuoE [Chloroflexota bacterium]MBI3762124.1 NADH-quinone oxidoreductase subunit NuoE [Chloroflexota bacterium]